MKGAEKIIREVLEPTGISINGSNPWDIQVKNPKLYQRVLAEGSVGLGEAYMDGWWDAKELDQFFFKLFLAELEKNQKVNATRIWTVLKAKLLNMQSKVRSKKVAEEHYDLGNEFYENTLDKNMQYTCGYWKGLSSNPKNLDKAQEQKLDLVCRKLKLKKSDKVLELGGGWGGFAYYAAKKYGCHVTSYNISKEQVEYAKKKCKRLPVEIIKDDYRHAKGKFDKIASIGMCEHVGPKNYRNFFKLAKKCMRDKNSLFLMHTIGSNVSEVSLDPWMDKYIFPNAVIPSAKQLTDAAEGVFVIEDFHNFGPDYDKTLMAWFANFNKNWPKFKKQFGERFYKMWKYYLLSCAGNFRSRKVSQLFQFVFSKGGIVGGYESER